MPATSDFSDKRYPVRQSLRTPKKRPEGFFIDASVIQNHPEYTLDPIDMCFVDFREIIPHRLWGPVMIVPIDQKSNGHTNGSK